MEPTTTRACSAPWPAHIQVSVLIILWRSPVEHRGVTLWNKCCSLNARGSDLSMELLLRSGGAHVASEFCVFWPEGTLRGTPSGSDMRLFSLEIGAFKIFSVMFIQPCSYKRGEFLQ